MYTDDMYAAYEQQQRSRTKTARNQCPECGVFRLDGGRPTVHRYQCSKGPDGSNLGVIAPTPTAGINPQKRPRLDTAPAKHTQKARR
jgi:predicted RNA-binding Zn-ribbon protein involved in translation (DUF1610 family)